MLDAMLDIFGVILGPKVGGRMDKMATGRFYVWTRSSPIILGQVDVWTGSVGGAEFFFFQNVGSAVQKYSNLAHGKIVINRRLDPCLVKLGLPAGRSGVILVKNAQILRGQKWGENLGSTDRQALAKPFNVRSSACTRRSSY